MQSLQPSGELGGWCFYWLAMRVDIHSEAFVELMACHMHVANPPEIELRHKMLKAFDAVVFSVYINIIQVEQDAAISSLGHRGKEFRLTHLPDVCIPGCILQTDAPPQKVLHLANAVCYPPDFGTSKWNGEQVI